MLGLRLGRRSGSRIFIRTGTSAAACAQRPFTTLLHDAIESAAVSSTETANNPLWSSSTIASNNNDNYEANGNVFGNSYVPPTDRRHLIIKDDLSNWSQLPSPQRSINKFIPEGVGVTGCDPFELVSSEVSLVLV